MSGSVRWKVFRVFVILVPPVPFSAKQTDKLIGLCPSCLSVCFAGAGWVGKLGDKYFENVSLPSLAVL